MQFLWHFLSQTPSEYKSERYQSFLSYFYSLLDPTNTASVILKAFIFHIGSILFCILH